MGSKGGSSFDPTPLIEAGDRSIDLQREIYEDTIDRSQPFYNAGVGAVNRLSDLLGVSGGSVQTRDQIREELQPQFTTTTQAQGQQLYIDPDGNITTAARGARTPQNPSGLGYDLYGGDISQPTTSIDQTGLNAAIDERLAGQETPNDFGSLLQTFGVEQFEEDPGFRFRQEEGQKALERQYAARGQSFTPQALKGLTRFNSDQASQEYNAAYNRFNNDQNNIFNRLSSLAGSGQVTNNQLASTGQNFAAQGSQTFQGIGNSIASAEAANASSPSLFGSLLGGAAQLGGAALSNPAIFTSDRNTKENLTEVGQENGHKIYEFNYIGDEKRYSGVMAQDLLETHPDAVVDIDGVLHVDYGRIGVEMREVA